MTSLRQQLIDAVQLHCITLVDTNTVPSASSVPLDFGVGRSGDVNQLWTD